MAITKIPAAGFSDAVNFRNIIINGSMDLAQRSTSVTGIGNGDSGYHTVDRFKFVESGSPSTVFTQSQSTDVPTGQGFAKSLKMDVTTADASLGADDAIYINTSVEGQNLQYLKKGTSSAESLTLSFWVKSNITGTYIFEIIDRDNDRAISKSYTISSANTWEKKTITYPGDTTGALDNDNARSFELIYWLGAGANFSSGTLQTSWGSRTTANDAVGQVNLGDSTSNEWYVTGVQLEAGAASDFEFLPHDVNLQRCKRYYQLFDDGDATSIITIGTSYATTTAYAVISLHPEMRTQPSIDQDTGTDYFAYLNAGNQRNFDSFAMSTGNSTNKFVRINNLPDLSTNTTSGQSGWLKSNNTSAFLAFDAEL
nr:putative carbohydrate binding domain containing protein [uncultured Mediterranean phage uvMED]